jgi:hypothetical protein
MYPYAVEKYTDIQKQANGEITRKFCYSRRYTCEEHAQWFADKQNRQLLEADQLFEDI